MGQMNCMIVVPFSFPINLDYGQIVGAKAYSRSNLLDLPLPDFTARTNKSWTRPCLGAFREPPHLLLINLNP